VVNIDEYKANIRDFIKRQGFSCIYLISCDKGIPTKIGVASDICARLTSIQTGNWVKLGLKYIIWLPGKAASDRVEAELHRRYSEYKICGEWFDLDCTSLEGEIEIVARLLYPSLILVTHSEMIKYAMKKIDNRVDRILARMGL
jgi:hypothetical protein